MKFRPKPKPGVPPELARPGSELAADICHHPLAMTHLTLIRSDSRAFKCAHQLAFQDTPRGTWRGGWV